LRFTDNNNNVAGSTQDVSLTGTAAPPMPVAGVSVASLTFAARTNGTTSPAQTVTLSNSGDAPLAIASIAVVGANPADFARSGGSCPTTAGSLAVGASCTIAVTFTPAATGARAATLRVTDNSNNVANSTQDVGLSGTGVAPVPVAGVAPASLAFAARPITTTSAVQTVTLSNTGTGPLTIASIATTGANAADFARSGGTCASTLAAGASCTVGVTFTPTAGGARSTTLRFTDNSNNTAASTQDVALTGTGQVPAITVNPTSQGFGNNSILLGILGVSRTLTVTSSGTAPLIFAGGAVTIVGTNANNFAITANNCSGSTRNPGATCSITVRFRAQAPVGNKTATLRIVSNATTSPTNIPLTGRAQA
jgi:hypothetical protein